MTYQPPVTPGYSPHPPRNDWAPPAKKRGRSMLPWVIAVLAVFVAGGAWLYVSRVDEPDATSGSAPAVQAAVAVPEFAAAQECDVLKLGTSIRDGGRTLIIDTRGEKNAGSTAGMSVDELRCALNAMGAPESVQAAMWATRALDGRQEGEWPGFKASWSYHPDNGLDAIFTATS